MPQMPTPSREVDFHHRAQTTPASRSFSRPQQRLLRAHLPTPAVVDEDDAGPGRVGWPAGVSQREVPSEHRQIRVAGPTVQLWRVGDARVWDCQGPRGRGQGG